MHPLRKKNLQIEEAHIKEIETLENELTRSHEQQHSERLKQELDNKKKELDKITKSKINGLITRSKAQIIEQNERNSKYFASLETKKGGIQNYIKIKCKSNHKSKLYP